MIDLVLFLYFLYSDVMDMEHKFALDYVFGGLKAFGILNYKLSISLINEISLIRAFLFKQITL